MANTERPIVVTNDLDGVHFYTPPPLDTTLRLLRGKLSLPEEVQAIQEYIPPAGFVNTILARLFILFHQYRPLIPGALRGLQRFREVGDTHGREVVFAVLSGRKKDKHGVTLRILERAGYSQYFTQWLLNEGDSPVVWKEFQTRRLVDQGYSVVHLEDDLRAGLCVARAGNQFGEDHRVLVYLLKNLSNHPRLLRRAGITIPGNLVSVGNFQEACEDFDKRLSSGAL
jgi:hypothetical protein